MNRPGAPRARTVSCWFHCPPRFSSSLSPGPNCRALTGVKSFQAVWGDGLAYYVAGHLPSTGWETLLATIIQERFGLALRPDDLDVVRWECDGYGLTFAVNPTDAPLACALDAPGTDLVTSRTVKDSIDVPPRGAAVVRTAR